MSKKTKLVLIFLEGDEKSKPKQEQNFFEWPQSKSIWTDSVKKFGFWEFEIFIWPKAMDGNKNKHERRLSQLITNLNKSKKPAKVIITGDHDEDAKHVLEAREVYANYIKEAVLCLQFMNDEDCTIILEKHKYFKLETIMNEFQNSTIFPEINEPQKMNKKSLKKTFNKECPQLLELITDIHSVEDQSQAKDIVVKVIANSNLKIFQEIRKNKK